jgi:hypothetical protein
MPYDPLDADADPFKPPPVPVEVFCLHCQSEYESYLIEWRVMTDADGKTHGFWCCPTPGCGGMGFGFDIHPADPDYQDERGGWVHDDGGEDIDAGGSNGEANGHAGRPPDNDSDIPW